MEISNEVLMHLEDTLQKLIAHVSQLDEMVGKVKSDLDDHLLDHLIEDRNKEFRFNYSYGDE